MNKPFLLTVLAILIVGYSFEQTQYNGIENYKRLDSVFVYTCSESDSIYYSKDIYSYDESGNQIIDIEYRWELNNWTLYSKSFYYFSSPSTKINELANEDLNLYPNPTTGQINITVRCHIHYESSNIMTNFI